MCMWCGITVLILIRLCMRWLYDVNLLTWPACHDSAWWLEPYDCTLMTCVSTLSYALILLAIEIAILSSASTRWWQSSRRWTPTRMPKTKNTWLLRQKGLYHVMLIMNCLRCLSLMMHPSWLRGSRFLLGWSLTKKKYQVVSVLPSVAPSRHLTSRSASCSHEYKRLGKCEAGEVRPRSEITWLSWRSGMKVMSSEHTHRKMNKSHIEMWLASWPTDCNSRHLRWMHPWRWIVIWILYHSKSIMRDIDLSGSALQNYLV